MAETCQVCGEAYDTVYDVPDAIWQQITPKIGEAGLLCLRCADSRARELGITLYWGAGIDGFPHNPVAEASAAKLEADWTWLEERMLSGASFRLADYRYDKHSPEDLCLRALSEVWGRGRTLHEAVCDARDGSCWQCGGGQPGNYGCAECSRLKATYDGLREAHTALGGEGEERVPPEEVAQDHLPAAPEGDRTQ